MGYLTLFLISFFCHPERSKPRFLRLAESKDPYTLYRLTRYDITHMAPHLPQSADVGEYISNPPPYTSFASSVISAFSSRDTGQPALASAAAF